MGAVKKRNECRVQFRAHQSIVLSQCLACQMKSGAVCFATTLEATCEATISKQSTASLGILITFEFLQFKLDLICLPMS